MKRIIATAIIGAMIGTTSYAADMDVEILGVSADNGLITVEVANNLPEKTRISFEMINQNESLSDEEEIYALYQVEAEKDRTVVFKVQIPDDKKGIPGTGTYMIEVENGNEDRAAYTFDYADSNSIGEFLDSIKRESEKVTDSDKAYENILPLFTAKESKGIFFSFGLDYDEFMATSDDVKNEMINLLYDSGIDDMTGAEFAGAFGETYGLAIYNSGDKEGAIAVFKPVYGGKAIDEKIAASAVEYMEKSYDSAKELTEAFAESYGIETINRANSNNMEDVLEIFKDETGLCKNDIDKILKLSSAKAYDAYDYIVSSCKSNNLESAEELEELLEKAYDKAAKEQSSSGGGGGGSSAGGVGNSVPSKTTYASAVQGSGGVDKKTEAANVFADLSVEHWAAEAVSYLKSKGVVSGNEKGLFEPERSITREEFAKMLVNICEIETDGADTEFADAEKNGWYREYIGAAAEAGIVNGVGDGKFGVGQKIIRQDMAVMTARAIKYKGIELAKVKEYPGFADENDISDYAKNNIAELFEAGVINGKGGNMFEPFGNATRAEAAKIIYEAFKGGE